MGKKRKRTDDEDTKHHEAESDLATNTPKHSRIQSSLSTRRLEVDLVENTKPQSPMPESDSESTNCTCPQNVMKCVGILPASSLITYLPSDTEDSDNSVNDDLMVSIFPQLERTNRRTESS